MRTTRTNVGSPTGRESYGDGGPVVVAGVATCQGGRESRPQGQGGQVIEMPIRIGRYAKCRTPKRCWVSCGNEVGGSCRVRSCIGNCSTRSCIYWPTAES